MSPTNLTRSVQNIGRLSAGGIIGNICIDGSPRSFPAWKTARTPGIASASDTSTPSSTPWATIERTNATCSIPGSTRSSRYLPVPVSSVGSSRRSTAFPRIEPDDVMFPPSCGPWQHGHLSHDSGFVKRSPSRVLIPSPIVQQWCDGRLPASQAVGPDHKRRQRRRTESRHLVVKENVSRRANRSRLAAPERTAAGGTTSMTGQPVRRVVTGHDASNQSVIVADGAATPRLRRSRRARARVPRDLAHHRDAGDHRSPTARSR